MKEVFLFMHNNSVWIYPLLITYALWIHKKECKEQTKDNKK